MQYRFRKLLAGALATTMLAGMLPAALAAEEETTITIIGLSDVHSNVWGYSYEDNKESAGGLAAISTYMKALRAENDNVILVDNGDSIQGTIMTDDLCNKNPDKAHPVIAAMNYMDFDAVGLGNHEFNWGVPSMNKIMGQAEMPVICANIRNGDGELVTGEGWTMVERSGIKVAIIAVDTPNIQRWDGGKEGIDDLDCRPLADGVGEALEEIKAAGGADVYYVMAHAGLEAEYSTDDTDAAKSILAAYPEITALQCGHTHTTYQDNEGAIPVGQTKNGATEVARYDITLDADKNVTSAKVEIVSVKDQAPDEELRALEAVKNAHEETIAYVTGNVLGHSTARFQPEDEIKGLPQGKLEDTAVMDLINTIQLKNAGADVSAAALFKDTSDLPEGDLNYGNVFDIYKFDNTLYRVNITGAQLKAYMEWSVSHYNTWTPGDINVSFDASVPGYLYDMFAGVDYEINLSKPAGERIENVMYKGEPLKDDEQLKLAVNNYRFSSTVKAMVGEDAKEWESSNSIRDMIVAYMAENDPMTPAVDNNWKITGIDLQLDSAERAAYIEKINAGEIATPYNKSINLNELNNVLLDGAVNSAAVVDNGVQWFRLRDIATILKGTDLAFNVDWDEVNAQVVITKGGEYTAPAMDAAAYEAAEAEGAITILVDGDMLVEVQTVLLGGNYYVSVEGLNALLGTSATVADGVLSLSATINVATGVAG